MLLRGVCLAVVQAQNLDCQGCLHKGASPAFCQQVEITLYIYCIKKKEEEKKNQNGVLWAVFCGD